MNVAWKKILVPYQNLYENPFKSDLRAYAEVGQLPTNRRHKYAPFCKLHFSNGDLWEGRTFTQRTKRCRTLEGISEFINQYSGNQSIIFVTDCPLDMFHFRKLKSDYVGWEGICATIFGALRNRSHLFGLQYLPSKQMRQTIEAIEIRRQWALKAAPATEGKSIE